MTSLQSLIQSLSRPEALPHPSRAPTEVRQTHISVLIFAGDRVYKIKKPVSLGFLDFSTLGRRLHFCCEEVRLNRPLAPGVHLGVCAVLPGADGGLTLSEPVPVPDNADISPVPGAVEYAVAMRRLPADRMLSALLDRGELDNALLERLAATLAAFHASAPAGDDVQRAIAPGSVSRRLFRNLDECAVFSPDPLSPRLLSRLRDHFQRILGSHDGLLRRRVAERRARDGHGDLHADNICILPDRVLIYDRIEFTPDFRRADAASDLAFLCMDLDLRGYRGHAGHLAARYAAHARDPDLRALLPLYKAHFAAVRAKVAALRAADANLPETGRADATTESCRYLNLAAAYTLPPALILTCGLPGTGKSVAARAVAEPSAAALLRSDEVRKRLMGMEPTARYRGPLDAGPYTPDLTDRTYAALLDAADGFLGAGRTVVVDATFRAAAQRAPFRALAAKHNAPVLIIHLSAPDEVIEARLARRAHDPGEVSDADVRVYRHLRASFEPPDEFAAHERLDTPADFTPVALAARVIERLAE